MYTLVDVPGKGVGCVATGDIRRGTLILRERPVLEVAPHIRELDFKGVEERWFGWKEDRVEFEKEKLEYSNVVEAFTKLSDKEKEEYLNLKFDENFESNIVNCDVPADLIVKICSIYKTNTFHNGVCLKLSRFNHSCWPNTECFWNFESNTRDIVAVEDISKGEEICHNYLQKCALLEDRHKSLLKKWNFICSCRLCSKEYEETARATYICIEARLFDKTLDNSDEFTTAGTLCQFATTVKGIRILNMIKLLDGVYEELVRNTFLLSKSDQISLENAAAAGLFYSALLYGSGHKTTKLWKYRLHSPAVYLFTHSCCTAYQHLITIVTAALIAWNFWTVAISQYLLLLTAYFAFQKIHC